VPDGEVAVRKLYPLRALARAALRSATLLQVWLDFRRKAGLATVRAIGLAALFAAITYYVSNQSVGVSVASSVLLAIVVAFLSLVVLLVVAVGNLELSRDQWFRDYWVLRRKISAQLAISDWVRGCETSLHDRGNPVPAAERAKQELTQLEANVVNSLRAYTFGGDTSGPTRSTRRATSTR
jgi:hypothetical protein